MWNSTSRTMMALYGSPGDGRMYDVAVAIKGMYEWLAPLSLLFLWSGALFSKQIYIHRITGLGWLEMDWVWSVCVFQVQDSGVGIGFWCCPAYCIWIFHPP